MTKNKEKESWKVTGYIQSDEVELPSEDRLKDRPVAIIECPQEIPCDPCVAHCPVDAIKMKDLNSPPEVNFEECSGCSTCVQQCPGLAVFMVEYKNGMAEITIPYEFELPEVGEEVDALNRKGERVCTGKVVDKISKKKSSGDTPLVTVEVAKEYVKVVRNIRRGH